eukprot:1592435-Pyramimonas_sp.AAC.1
MPAYNMTVPIPILYQRTCSLRLEVRSARILPIGKRGRVKPRKASFRVLGIPRGHTVHRGDAASALRFNQNHLRQNNRRASH